MTSDTTTTNRSPELQKLWNATDELSDLLNTEDSSISRRVCGKLESIVKELSEVLHKLDENESMIFTVLSEKHESLLAKARASTDRDSKLKYVHQASGVEQCLMEIDRIRDPDQWSRILDEIIAGEY